MHTLNILGQKLNIDFEIEYYSGRKHPEIEEVRWEEDLYDTWQNAEIKKQIATEDFDFQICKKIKS